ncbi:small GTPase superfamily [Mycena maculata]|uniref:Small GTPase superfamily n=1 Tax=Mycena maculata TaxID=230809 RepID=A0AAD7KGT6_9AGAR|nr:small GTPase superfamily [Mycena maculata]
MPGAVTLNTRKIVVLGSRSVGKSSLVKQFVEGHYSDVYYPNTESSANKVITYNGTEFPCELIDTAGQDEFSQLNSRYAIGIHGYVLVYSIASRASFEMVQIIYDKIVDYCGLRTVPAVIVGAKADLNACRQVDAMDGARLAHANGAAWIEASALRDENVGKAFELCLAEIERGTAGAAAPPAPPDAPGGKCVVM